VSARLPGALQDAIARFTDEIAPKELAARTASLSECYRGGAGSDAAIRDDRDVAAYLATRLPATYAAMAAALDAVQQRAPQFVPGRLLDAGAGPGTASWAAVELWPLVQSVTMLDRHPRLLAAARTLAQSSPHPGLATAIFVAGDLAATVPSPTKPEFVSPDLAGPSHDVDREHNLRFHLPLAGRSNRRSASARGGSGGGSAAYDLVLAGYALAELPPQRVADTALALWNACSGVLVIVEPGTPAGFARILACRSALLTSDACIVAPCPAPYPCPIISPDWCHFAQRLPRSRAHLRAKSAQVPFEDEKFSYLAVARKGVELAPVAARIIAPPRAEKPGIRLRLCTGGQIAERTVLKRDKPAFKSISRKSWGDAI
jgi:ribosomal protein RSM22 (predicted rRNA methylase)